MRSQSPDLTVFDLLHALNDAIEAAGDFGSFKKIIPSTLDLAFIVMEHPGKSPLFTHIYEAIIIYLSREVCLIVR